MTDNRELVRRFFEEAARSGDPEKRWEYLDRDVLIGSGEGTRLDDYLEASSSDLAALEVTLKVEDMVADGEKVAARITVSGKQVGEFMGLPATGKEFSFDEMVITQLRDGRISRIWRVFDLQTLLQQLGSTAATPAGG